MKTPEGKLKEQVKAFLTERKAYFFMPVQTGYGKTTVDFIGCYRGRFFAIETKAPGQAPNARQRRILDEITRNGGIAVWCDKWDASTMEAFLLRWME